jgi:hypothetical protein
VTPEIPPAAAGTNGVVLEPWPRVMISGALTTDREPPPASGSDSGGESDPSVTSAGNVTAAANATPATAADATIASPLLTRSPFFADPLLHGIGVINRQPKSWRINCGA